MKNETFWVFLLVNMLLLTSCYSYHAQVDKSSKKLFKQSNKPTAFIVNKTEFPNEFKVLKKSELYTLTNDSNSLLKIKLHKQIPVRRFNCFTGQAAVLLFTLGQLPVKTENNQYFKLEEIKKDSSKLLEFELKVDTRTWFWDILSWRKNFNKQLALSLRNEKVLLNKP